MALLPSDPFGPLIGHDLVRHEGLSAPVLGDEGEETMFDLVPFARTGREMADGYREAELVDELLKLDLPQPEPIAVTASSIRSDKE
jgi:hypothetical protein